MSSKLPVRPRLASALLLLTAGILSAQIGQYPPGGGYPPGSYPPGTYPPGSGRQPGQQYPGGGGIPGRSKKSSSKDQARIPTKSTKGMLRRIEGELLILEADDHRVLRYQISPATTYQKGDKKLAAADLKPGDHLTVDSSEDLEGNMFATSVTFEKAGTDSERAAASRDDSLLRPNIDPNTKTTPGEDERPRLRRKDGSGAEPQEVAKNTPAAAPAQMPLPDDADRPHTVVLKPEETIEKGGGADGERPPVLKRGKPQPRTEVARAEIPSLPPEPVRSNEPARSSGGIAPAIESPSATTEPAGNPLIEKARAAAATYLEGLPNYFCQEMTTRYTSDTVKPSWHAHDVITAELIYEDGKERYRKLAVNGKLTNKTLDEIGGSRSTGEFAATLEDVLSPMTAATFRFRRQNNIANRPAFLYDFTVEQRNSHWTIHSPAQSYRPAYKGSLWIDKETNRVMRIEMQARNLPSDFPFDAVETAVDWDFVRISGNQFLLPVHAENLSCIRGSSDCSKNEIDFRNYRKFGADSTLILK